MNQNELDEYTKWTQEEYDEEPDLYSLQAMRDCTSELVRLFDVIQSCAGDITGNMGAVERILDYYNDKDEYGELQIHARFLLPVIPVMDDFEHDIRKYAEAVKKLDEAVEDYGTIDRAPAGYMPYRGEV